MRRLLLIMTISLFVVATVNAQKDFSKNLTYGVKAGLNITKISIIDVTYGPVKSLITPTIGGYAEYKIDEKWGGRAELLYIGAGGYSNYVDDNGNSGKDKITMSYLSLPILAKYTLQKIPLSFIAGPQINFLLSGKEVDAGLTDRNNWKQISLSGILGCEYKINEKFSVDLRYHLAFGSIFTKEDDPLGVVRNRILSFSVGYKLK